jgi:hypothetical protein
MTYFDWFRTVAFALNDDEPGRPFQRYPLADMLAAFNTAMCLVAEYRPDLFTELRIVQLATGKHQDVRGCCDNVLDVIDQTDALGNIIKELASARRKPRMAVRRWGKASCLHADDEYIIDYAEVDPNMNGRFTVHPPVPCGVRAYVNVKCVSKPCPVPIEGINGHIDADCGHVAAAWHYVLARMLTGDRFGNAAGGDARYHFNLFYETLGVAQRQEDRIETPREDA